jgi:hypothetical protein
MNCMPSETRILRDRIEYLEEELRQLREDISPINNPFNGRFGLTRQQAAIAFAIYRHTSVSGPHLDRVTELHSRATAGTDYGMVANRTKVALCKVRKAFRKIKVEVVTIHGIGYRISLEHKDRLRKLLAR